MEKIKLFLYGNKTQIIVTSVIIIASVILVILYLNLSRKEEAKPILLVPKKEEVEEKKEIVLEEVFFYIDIKGAVTKPGIYKVAEDSRVNDVINMAGGLKWNADLTVINLSRKVFDEMVIYIYTKEEGKNIAKTIEIRNEKIEECNNSLNGACVKESEVIPNPKENNNQENEPVNNQPKKVSINNGTLEELMTLSGIGESRAKAIIEYRTKNKFETLEDLMKVSGIGQATFEGLKNDITL